MKAQMTKVAFAQAPCDRPIEVQVTGKMTTGALSISGQMPRRSQFVCDFEGPEGYLRIHDVAFASPGQGRRADVSFAIDYAGALGACSHDDKHPLVCEITPRSLNEPRLRLELGYGCTVGTLASDTTSWDIRTDEDRILGHTMPGVEVALLDEDGVVVFSKGDHLRSIDLFERPTAPPSSGQRLAVAAMQAYLGFEGTPVECVTPPL